jgi:hypothetical protein
MARYKSVLQAVEVVTAGRARKCYHSREHSVQKGDICLEVRDAQARKGYCVQCAREMVQQAQARLAEILSQLGT